MRRAALFLTAGILAFGADVKPADYLAHVRYLASDQLKGRATGSPELEQAAKYIQSQFASFGVKPIPGSAYQQEFTATIGARLSKNNRLRATLKGRSESLTLNQGFIPFSFSSTGNAPSAPVVFAGYGITAAEQKYDDYAGLDVKGKYVLILRHEPQENDAASVFAGRDSTQHATFANKAVNAKNHGARGVILINDTYSHPGERDALMAFGQSNGPIDAGIFFVQVTSSTAENWVKASGKDLRTLIQSIDKDLKPQSFTLTGLTASMNVDVIHEHKAVHNVMAYLPGKTDEYVIVGAHYDHLGLGDEHSLAPSQIGQIHHGADDNASGTAGVLELARWFSKQPQQQRGILFMTYAGEELGLLGSSYYSTHPLLPLEKAVTMLNMDMIGRIRDGKVYVNGTGTGSTLDAIVAAVKVPTGLKIDLSESTGYGGSDHISFTAKQVPVIFFFSGLHGDYHKPSDTSDKIDAATAVHLLDYVADIATGLMTAPGRPVYQRIPEKADPHSGGTAVTSGYGPNFGSVPDFDDPPKGVRFADVRQGTPADKAGLKAGDILIQFDGKDIANLYDFTYALQSHKAGDEVLVKVLRGSQSIEAKVLLTERR
ncbi:MAG: M28 family peptidase [Acidobacteriota bacterium]